EKRLEIPQKNLFTLKPFLAVAIVFWLQFRTVQRRLQPYYHCENRSPCLLAPCSWQLRDYSHSSTGVFFPSILARHRRLQCGWPLSQRFQGQSLTPRSLRMESRSHLCGIVTTASPQIFM